MKKVVAYLIATVIGSAEISMGQCDADGLTRVCIPKLAQGFNFLKSYKVEGGDNKEKVEYRYVFTTGTQYMVNLCVNGSTTEGVMVSLFDSGRNKVASSKIGNQFVPALQFSCGATGIYYIQYTFEGTASRCAGSALGFKR